ncbi:MAG: DUF1499 domain-containing protein [Leptolyngbyaceae cyanobacterium bins.349]|nr:DUF1499 domain-containing protein [Leptolyngbyaceae cyanobacterium bins.349]
MTTQSFGTPRPLWRVVLFSAITLLAYYGYYKWVIQDELRRYNGTGWSGAVSLLPFGLGVTLPLILAWLDPDVPSEFGWFSLPGVIWIYIVQFKLYRTVNRMYRDAGLPAPLVVWWLFIPGLNLIVGLRQIHFLSQFWAMKQQTSIVDPIAKALPVLFAAIAVAIIGLVGLPASGWAVPLQPPVLMGSLFSFTGERPTNLGVNGGFLAPCPTSPNCVSSQSLDQEHQIAPFTYTDSALEAMQRLKTIITGLPRTQIVQATDTYLYAEFTSKLMGFVDDVEFYLDPEAQVIQVRSASRLGESDLGVNRQRIEAIANQFNRPSAASASTASS